MSDKPIEDGGAAFPSKMLVNRFATEKTAQQLIGADGMSLRDYFAAAAMQGICSCNLSVKIEEIAKYAYEQADAMLQARKEGA